jgi:glyceraldehyde 3-phosphate dehydrogenase
MVRVAINGFGRIGRQVLRIGINCPELDFAAINDLTDAKTLAHLLKYDSSYGIFNGTIHADDKSITINGKRIAVIAEKEPEKLPWRDMGVELVAECTGLFTSREGAEKHIKAGAKRVLISAPAKGVKVIVKGVNENSYDKAADTIISNASCTTNCLAPMVKVLNDNFGIEKGFMTTIHAYTNDQRILDFPHKDLRRARSASVNIIPTTTGAAETVGEVIPELKGKLTGMAMRVPVPVGSITDFVAILKKPTTVQEVNWLFSEVAKYHLKGILQYSDEPLVSSDIVGNSNSTIFDSPSTMMLGQNFIKVVGWYDNEWGYSNRMVDLLKMMG